MNYNIKICVNKIKILCQSRNKNRSHSSVIKNHLSLTLGEWLEGAEYLSNLTVKMSNCLDLVILLLNDIFHMYKLIKLYNMSSQ
jgi:hypothetical protein